ncbi:MULTISPECIES: TVP38/TMEM64 family protein [unclassified Saccharibacter]|uniref:TVP38/TMEM64 family protein n=1 Tax=unclassified Saccharibacter TaxID=2648722 RepID=UPI001326BE0C|nr:MULTISPECIES: VTT domain-containing protein [unclassified Saccharibacter]MXV37028.1 hypothetical protein [Saccharibacter sp. EH611]MXV58482.1 hypothetical protein [Saccharibacter sp. EH70]MXV65988.1 hypothetical protein [Saccharibacter sp. EH60]
MREFARPFVLVIALIVVPLVVWRIPMAQHLVQSSQSWCRGPWAGWWFLVFAVPYCAAGLPRQALCLMAGAGFGVLEGFVLCSVAYEAGALVSYSGGRLFGVGRSLTLMKPMVAFMRRAPFKAVLSVRLLPIGSSLLVSTLSGGLRIPVFAFAGATALGGVPQNLIFILVGSGLPVGHQTEMILSAVLFALSTALGVVMVRRYRAYGAQPMVLSEGRK